MGLTRPFGWLFQARGEFMDLDPEPYAQSRGFCEDLNAERLSFLTLTSAKPELEAFRLIMCTFRA